MIALYAMMLAAPAGAVCGSVTLDSMVARYGALIRTQDNAAIAAMFAPDGQVINPGAPPIVGPAAVAALLGRFADFRVLTESMDPERIEGAGADWHVEGRFHQTGLTPEHKAYESGGHFRSDWTCAAGQWRVRRMETFS